jgi:K+-sensing histidine kinase KdpD
LSVVTKTDQRTFTEDDSLVLTILADYASIALENARLYDESRRDATMAIFRQTVTTLSHYINNPLTALMGAVHMLDSQLRHQDEPAVPALETLHTVEDKAQEIASVIAVLRDVILPTSIPYWEEEQMIDIEGDLRRRLKDLLREE